MMLYQLCQQYLTRRTLTNGLVECVRDVVVLLLVKIFPHLLAKLHLLSESRVLRRLRFALFTGRFSIREILRRRRMNLSLWTASVRSLLISPERGDGRGGTTRCRLLWRWRRRSGRRRDLLRHRRLRLENRQAFAIGDSTIQHTSSGGGICLICLSKTASTLFPIAVTG